MDEGSESSFVGTEIGVGMDTILPNSQSTRVDGPEVLPGGQMLFPSPAPVIPESPKQPTVTNVIEPHGPTNMGNMSTADMFKVISDLEQPKRPLIGVRHYGSDAAM